MRTCRAPSHDHAPSTFLFSAHSACECACVPSNFKIVVFNQSRFARDLGKQQHLNSHSTINPPIASNRRRHQHLWRKGARNAGRNARRKWDGVECSHVIDAWAKLVELRVRQLMSKVQIVGLLVCLPCNRGVCLMFIRICVGSSSVVVASQTDRTGDFKMLPQVVEFLMEELGEDGLTNSFF